MIELSDQTQLIEFIKQMGVFPPEKIDSLYVRYFGGGVSGTVVLVSDGEKSVIVKQALASLKVAAVWQCDRSRIKMEHKALEIYEKLVPESVPAAICYDEANYIMVREAAPEDCPMWKQLLLAGDLDFRIARKAIETLLTIHNQTAGDPEIAKTFGDGKFFYELRMNPYIEHVADIYPQIGKEADAVVHMLMSEHISLIHGDYSPKNILVSGERIYILDLEVAYYGHPAFDVAFFCVLFLTKSIKNKQWSDAYLNMLDYMTDLYFAGVAFMDPAALEQQSIRTLALLLLARIDGKSPVEYITEESDKVLTRKIAFALMQTSPKTFRELTALMRASLGTAQERNCL